MTQSVYYQRIRVNTCCFVTSSLPGIYKSLTDYCKLNSSLKKRLNAEAKWRKVFIIRELRLIHKYS
jgi:hypothetical protein